MELKGFKEGQLAFSFKGKIFVAKCRRENLARKKDKHVFRKVKLGFFVCVMY